MANKFINPITAAFDLLEQHRNLVRATLLSQDLSQEDVDEINSSLEVDRGLYLSLNRAYQTSGAKFRNWCGDHGLDDRLVGCFDRLAFRSLYLHQERAIEHILAGESTVVSTGTGSGKTEAFLIPILDYCIKNPGPGVKALIIYPMNALANDQLKRIQEAAKAAGVRVKRYIGGTTKPQRQRIGSNPPDILITNYVMLDYMLVRRADEALFATSHDSLRFIVLDEVHSYTGSKAADIKFLLARLKARHTGPFVHIATSATLQRGDGTSAACTDEALDDFVNPLFEIDGYKFVGPAYVPELVRNGEAISIPPGSDWDEVGWELEASSEAGYRNIERLMGKRYTRMPVGHMAESDVYGDLAAHPLTHLLREALIRRGAQSFAELADLVAAQLPIDQPAPAGEDVLRGYLSAALFINHQISEDESPFFDFRMHLLLRQAGGFLKRCIRCGRYHSGGQEFCQDCGGPLFYVYRQDIRRCIGKVIDHVLRWDLPSRKGDGSNAAYCFISPASPQESSAHGLTFSADGRAADGGISLEYVPEGTLHLTQAPFTSWTDVGENLIGLVEPGQTWRTLAVIAGEMLRFQPSNGRRLLGFIDSREKVSRYAATLQDEFASDFLHAYLRRNSPGRRRLDVNRTLQLLQQRKPAAGQLRPREVRVFDELPLWYWRTVGTLPQYDHRLQNLLALRDADSFQPSERELLEIFIAERAIATGFADADGKAKVFRFHRHRATDHRGITLVPGQASECPEYPSISLSPEAQKYGEFVQRTDADDLAGIVRVLVDRGVLVNHKTPDGKVHFAIDPGWVVVEVEPLEELDYEVIVDQYLFSAAAHSSEVVPEDRRQAEDDFKSDKLQVLIATPTLEMGIDIGDLQSVLMIGAPPSPANYAQRAGRAGRSHGDRSALIVTYCSEDNEHDEYFFRRPRLMIDGEISPPRFDPRALEIARQHVNAVLIAGRADDVSSLRTLVNSATSVAADCWPDVRRIFGEWPEVESYVRNEFAAALRCGFNGGARRAHDFYQVGFLPDYGFRRDLVSIVPIDHFAACRGKPKKISKEALSQREPDLAYAMFAPGKTMFMAGEPYRILAEPGDFESIRLDDDESMRRYDLYAAEPVARHATQRSDLALYDRAVMFDNAAPFECKRSVVALAFNPECRLLFVNRGRLDRRPDEEDPFSKDGHHFNIGYEIRRPVFVLRFYGPLFDDPTAYISLVSALDIAIRKAYRLGDAEFRPVLYPRPLPEPDDEDPWVYALFYPHNACGNVPVESIWREFDDIVVRIYEQASACDGERHDPCADGCYHCVRSYATRGYADNISKASAAMFSGYLLGKNRFQPSIAAPPAASARCDLELCLERHGQSLSVTGGQTRYECLTSGKNYEVFDLLTQAVEGEYRPGIASLRVHTNLKYVADALNARGTIKEDRAAFARLQFSLLRFQRVCATSGRES